MFSYFIEKCKEFIGLAKKPNKRDQQQIDNDTFNFALEWVMRDPQSLYLTPTEIEEYKAKIWKKIEENKEKRKQRNA